MMKCKKISAELKFHYEKESPFEIKIDRQNPTVKQIEEIRKMLNKTIDEEIERITNPYPNLEW